MSASPEHVLDAHRRGALLVLHLGRASVTLPILALCFFFAAFSSSADELMLFLAAGCALASPLVIVVALAKSLGLDRSDDEETARLARRGALLARIGALICLFEILAVAWVHSSLSHPGGVYF
jgi:hypothetical protein